MINFPSWSDFGTHDESRFPELWEGCVGAWAPCLGPTGLRLHDHSRFGNWGALTNMDAATDWVITNGQYALDFDTTDDLVEPSSASLTGLVNVSVSAWVVIRSNGTRVFASRYANAGVLNGWLLYGDVATGFAFDGRESGAAYLSSGASGAFSLGQWYHVCGTKRGNLWSVFVDGRLRSSQTQGNGTTVFSVNALQIGAGWFGGSDYLYSGAILDDVRIYNRALTELEIRNLALGRGVAYQRRRRKSHFAEQLITFRAAWARNSNYIISPVGAA